MLGHTRMMADQFAAKDEVLNSLPSEKKGVGPIRACVKDTVETYFRNLNGHDGDALYRMVLDEVEQPLLEVVMRHCGGNQTRAAQILGINRGTLRKKLQQYDLDH